VYGSNEPEITLTRDCEAIVIPHGYRTNLPKESKVRILQRLGGSVTVTAEFGGLFRVGPEAAIAIHLVNGAVFGATFERLGLRGPVSGVVMAQAESLSLWPAMRVVDHVHEDRRSGGWPPLWGNRRVFAYEVAAHALFGAVLGGLLSPIPQPFPRRQLPAAQR